MVSIFPPQYGLVPIFNISYNSIIEIIQKGYSDNFTSKCEKILNTYYDSKGIDEDEMPFIKRLKKRCIEYNKNNTRQVSYEEELNKAIIFLETVLKNKQTYFIDYVTKGRKLKKVDQDLYIKHKLSSISYTPFGVFDSREANSLIKSSHHLYFDIDEKFTREENKKIINFFITDPYIKASWLSFSGKGFAFIVESNWKTDIEMRKCYYKLLEYFTQELIKIGIKRRVFDSQVCNINRMNFISYKLIKKSTTNKIFEFEDYSENLYYMLHERYKKNSTLHIPNRILTEEDSNKDLRNKKLIDTNNREKIILRDEKAIGEFMKTITKNVCFSGSNDYNTAIKEFINKVFVFQIDEDVIESFLFDRIPYNIKTEKTFRTMWNNYAKFTTFQSVEPYMYY